MTDLDTRLSAYADAVEAWAHGGDQTADIDLAFEAMIAARPICGDAVRKYERTSLALALRTDGGYPISGAIGRQREAWRAVVRAAKAAAGEQDG